MADLSDIVHTVGHELNMAHDMEPINFRNFKKYDESKDFGEQILNNLKDGVYNIAQFAWVAKPIVRGAAIGSMAGAVGGAISGNDIGEAAKIGALYGLYIDENIFMCRFLWKYVMTRFGKYDK
jgi:hypothetical protein